MRMMAFALLFGAVVSAAGCGNSGGPTGANRGGGGPGGGDDQSRFQGTWTITKFEFPPDMAEDKKKDTEEGLKDVEVVISGEQVTGLVPKKPGSPEKDTIKGTFKLDPAKTPKEIDVTGSPEGKGAPTTLVGIYKFDGDALVVAIAVSVGSDAPVARPGEFKPVTEKKNEREGRRVVLIHLKKK